jgi:predicted phosphodiesterase
MSTLSFGLAGVGFVAASVENQIGFFSDPHGDFSSVKKAVRAGVPKLSLFLGDFDLERPMEEELSPLLREGSEVYFVHGNHDADTEVWHDFVFNGSMALKNLTGRVIEFDGIKVAGLGGVFRAGVWHPKDGDGLPKFASREAFMDANRRNAWRDGLPLRQRSTIFPEDFNALLGQEADILITHEAPSSHEYGFSEIDDLAELLGVKVIVHGHLHKDYRAVLPNGIKVVGLDKAALLLTDHDRLFGSGAKI